VQGSKSGALHISLKECAMNYSFIAVCGHIEVYDENGIFLFSADNRREARQELEKEFA